MPTVCEFHPAFTLLGTQPSIVVCLKSGLIAKCNRPGAERVVHSKPLNPPVGLAVEADIAAAVAERKQALDAVNKVEEPPPEVVEVGKKGRGKSSRADLSKSKADVSRGETAKQVAPRRGSKKGEALQAHGEPVEVAAALDDSVLDREYFAGHGTRVRGARTRSTTTGSLSFQRTGLGRISLCTPLTPPRSGLTPPALSIQLGR